MEKLSNVHQKKITTKAFQLRHMSISSKTVETRRKIENFCAKSFRVLDNVEHASVDHKEVKNNYYIL